MVPQGAGVRVPENPIGDGPGRHAMVSDVANAPLAQLAEQRTLNPRVRGSSPWRRTRDQGSDLAVLAGSEPFSRPLWTVGCSWGALEPLDRSRPVWTGWIVRHRHGDLCRHRRPATWAAAGSPGSGRRTPVV